MLTKQIQSVILKPKKTVAVVIPLYKETLSKTEEISLTQCIDILGKSNPIIFVTFKSLNLSNYKSYLSKKVESSFLFFDESYFKNIGGYNRLMLSDRFYSSFLDYKYILIYQLDAFVFRDELLYWCNMNYAYIGAPWINPWWYQEVMTYIYSTSGFLSKLKRTLLTPTAKNMHLVGNGGFSLRSVKSFYLISLLLKRRISQWQKNEDVFWSIFIPMKFPFFKIPPDSVARKFSFENEPKYLYHMNNAKLPFGCHGFEKYDIDFWKSFIQNRKQ
jgi:hypothetical protein